MKKVFKEAEKSAEVTHNHPEGIKGTQATAATFFLARNGAKKEDIKDFAESTFGNDLSENIDSVRKWYRLDVSCQGTVSYAIRSFFVSESFEGAIRKAISLGGDSDTLSCITGGISQAYYNHIPDKIKKEVMKRLPKEFRVIIEKFYNTYNVTDNLYI
ncbi:MAG: ADP-ribosylglycohydrolase family protein [Thermotogota bacterium]|nr:ADP-ribosylglycohydrolase family protein [Thermotogota bacterium]